MSRVAFRLVSAVAFGCLALVVMIAEAGGFFNDDTPLTLSAVIGAGVAGFLVAPLFWRPGQVGAVLAVLGGCLAVVIAGAVGVPVLFILFNDEPIFDTLEYVPAGAVFAPAIVLHSIIGAVLWVLTIALLRWLAIRFVR